MSNIIDRTLEKRFIIKESVSRAIFIDTETGIQYLLGYLSSGTSGMTLLVDKDGKPLLDTEYSNNTKK